MRSVAIPVGLMTRRLSRANKAEARGRQRLSEAAGRRSHGRGRAAPGGRSCQETAEQT